MRIQGWLRCCWAAVSSYPDEVGDDDVLHRVLDAEDEQPEEGGGGRLLERPPLTRLEVRLAVLVPACTHLWLSGHEPGHRGQTGKPWATSGH